MKDLESKLEELIKLAYENGRRDMQMEILKLLNKDEENNNDM